MFVGIIFQKNNDNFETFFEILSEDSVFWDPESFWGIPSFLGIYNAFFLDASGWQERGGASTSLLLGRG